MAEPQSNLKAEICPKSPSLTVLRLQSIIKLATTKKYLHQKKKTSK